MKKELQTVRTPATAALRPLRADAQRNRDAILAAALAAFEEEGVLASLDGIAARAGIGNATLYRNFPTRNDLLAAVMEANLATMLAMGNDLAGSLGARDALAEWLFKLTWQLRIWHDLPSCVASARGDSGSSMNATNAQLVAATGKLLDQAKLAGDAVDSVTAMELFELTITMSWGVDRFGDDEPTARRRVANATAGIFHT
jgi:AcrR family transcriptional regulator